MKKTVVAVSLVAVALAVVVARKAGAGEEAPAFRIAGIGVGSPVHDVLALVPEEERPFAACWRTVELVVPVRAFELDGKLSVKSRFGRVVRLGLFLDGEKEDVRTAVTGIDRELSASYQRSGDPSWLVYRAADGASAAQLHVYGDSLALIAGEFE